MTDQPTPQRPAAQALRRAALLAAALLAIDLLDVAGVLYHKHGHYAVEEWFGFYAVAGLAASALAVLAGWLGRLLRPRRHGRA